MAQIGSIYPIKNGLGLRELRAVLAVAELGSFRRAAPALGYTQSTLSHQVSALEAALGRPLFHRPGGRGQVRLTPAGQAVCRRARRALGEIEALAAEAAEAGRGDRALVRVGVSQTAAAEIMPPALRAFQAEYPGAEVVLSEVTDGDDVADALRRARLDLAFANNPEPDEFIEAVPVLADPWVILTRHDSEIAGMERPGFDALDGADLVAWTHRWRGQAALEEAWSRRGIAPRIVYRTDDNLALQRLVAAGLGHACIGRLAASRAVDSSLTWVSPHNFMSFISPREIALCYPRRQLTAAALALVGAILAQAAGGAGSGVLSP